MCMNELYPIRPQHMKKENRVSFDCVAVFLKYIITDMKKETFFMFFFIILFEYLSVYDRPFPLQTVLIALKPQISCLQFFSIA